MSTENPLLKVYGEDAVNLAQHEIKELAKNSNIPFDTPYIKLGISFLMLKCESISSGEKPKSSLTSLVSESFGEAAIYKYNCAGGVI